MQQAAQVAVEEDDRGAVEGQRAGSAERDGDVGLAQGDGVAEAVADEADGASLGLGGRRPGLCRRAAPSPSAFRCRAGRRPRASGRADPRHDRDIQAALLERADDGGGFRAQDGRELDGADEVVVPGDEDQAGPRAVQASSSACSLGEIGIPTSCSRRWLPTRIIPPSSVVTRPAPSVSAVSSGSRTDSPKASRRVVDGAGDGVVLSILGGRREGQ